MNPWETKEFQKQEEEFGLRQRKERMLKSIRFLFASMIIATACFYIGFIFLGIGLMIGNAGAILNKIVVRTNNYRMPVFGVSSKTRRQVRYEQSVFYGRHCLLTKNLRFRFLADIFFLKDIFLLAEKGQFGEKGMESIGDILIAAGVYLACLGIVIDTTRLFLHLVHPVL